MSDMHANLRAAHEKSRRESEMPILIPAHGGYDINIEPRPSKQPMFKPTTWVRNLFNSKIYLIVHIESTAIQMLDFETGDVVFLNTDGFAVRHEVLDVDVTLTPRS